MNPNTLKKAIIHIFLVIIILVMPIEAAAIENGFDDFFDNYKSIMLIIDVETGDIVKANQAAADFYGYGQVELTSMKIQDINQHTSDEIEAEMQVAFEESRNYFLFDHKLASGEIRNVEVYSYPLQINGSNQLYSIIHDVTEKIALQKTLDNRNDTMSIIAILFMLIQMGIIFLFWRSLRENKRIQWELSKSKEQYQALFDNMQEGFALHEIITDENGIPVDYRYIDANRAFVETTGLKDIEGKTVMDILPDTEDLWVRNFGKVALTGESTQFESYAQAIGKYYHVHAFSPKKNQFATISFDVTKRVEVEHALEDEKEKLRITLMSAGEGFAATDAKGRIESMNKMAEQLSGWTEEEVKGMPFGDIFKLTDESDESIEYFPVEDVLETRMTVERNRNLCFEKKESEKISVALTAAPIVGSKENLHGVVIVFRDISEENKYRKKIEYMSYHDHLTGLYNRRFFEEEISRLDTARNLPFSVVYADLNGLKIINDAFGHEQGDMLLSEATKVLKKCCRSDDIIARVGGDEFAILLPNTSFEMAKELVSRIRASVDQVQLDTGKLSVALGWETKTEESQSMEEIIRKSENYMYKRKLTESAKVRGEVVKGIMKTLFNRIDYGKSHSKGVSFLSGELGRSLGLPEGDIKELEILGIYHDIGMIGIDEEILKKPNPLSEDEWKEIRRHPELGRRILRSSGKFSDLSKYVASHHERWDGNGHPKGLKGKEIPFPSRILALADAYEAMINKREYKKQLSKGEAMEEIKRNMGTQFDPHIASVFLDYLADS
jgi:diguanylate cyclase (GGDEF)-like protein/PAS domain S-box-containing protein